MSKYKRVIKTYGGRKATFPLKDKRDMDSIAYYFLRARDKARSEAKRWQADRNWMMCLLGFNTAFRAEDLLQLRVFDVLQGYVTIKENKTGKVQNFRMRKELAEDIGSYIERNNLGVYDYLFCGQKNSEMAITRQQADNVLKKVARDIKLKGRLSMHTMRKTFGYHYYKDDGKLLTLTKMYNHDSPETTLLYICWDTDDAENDRMKVYNAGVHRKKQYKKE